MKDRERHKTLVLYLFSYEKDCLTKKLRKFY